MSSATTRSSSGPSPSLQGPTPPPSSCREKRPRPSDDSDPEGSHPSTSASHKKRKELISEDGEAACSEEGEVVCSEEERCLAELLVRTSRLPALADTTLTAEEECESMDELPEDASVNETTDEGPRRTAPPGSSPIVYAETDDEEPGSESESETEDENPMPTPTPSRSRRREEADAGEHAVMHTGESTTADSDANLNQPTATTAPNLDRVSDDIFRRLLLLEHSLQRRIQRHCYGRAPLEQVLQDMVDYLLSILALIPAFKRALDQSDSRRGGSAGQGRAPGRPNA